MMLASSAIGYRKCQHLWRCTCLRCQAWSTASGSNQFPREDDCSAGIRGTFWSSAHQARPRTGNRHRARSRKWHCLRWLCTCSGELPGFCNFQDWVFLSFLGLGREPWKINPLRGFHFLLSTFLGRMTRVQMWRTNPSHRLARSTGRNQDGTSSCWISQRPIKVSSYTNENYCYRYWRLETWPRDIRDRVGPPDRKNRNQVGKGWRARRRNRCQGDVSWARGWSSGTRRPSLASHGSWAGAAPSLGRHLSAPRSASRGKSECSILGMKSGIIAHQRWTG